MGLGNLSFNGMRIIESVLLTEPGEPYQVRRTWRERLFTWPWTPMQTERTVVPRIPYRGAVQLNATTLVIHPATLRQLKGIREMPSINDWAAKIARKIADEFAGQPWEPEAVDVEKCAAIIQLHVERWLIEEVDERDVPNDEGNGDALVYNLVMLLRHGRPYRQYEYGADQDKEIATWQA